MFKVQSRHYQNISKVQMPNEVIVRYARILKVYLFHTLCLKILEDVIWQNEGVKQKSGKHRIQVTGKQKMQGPFPRYGTVCEAGKCNKDKSKKDVMVMVEGTALLGQSRPGTKM